MPGLSPARDTRLTQEELCCHAQPGASSFSLRLPNSTHPLGPWLNSTFLLGIPGLPGQFLCLPTLNPLQPQHSWQPSLRTPTTVPGSDYWWAL